MPIKVLNEFLPPADEEKLGAIIVGDTLEVDSEGILEIDTTSVLGKYYSNCITEIPQIVKLELNGTTLTLKAGSKAYIPAGANNTFNEYNVTEDIIWSQETTLSGNYFLCLYSNNDALSIELLSGMSGNTFPENPSDTQKFYKSNENLMYRYNGERTTWYPAEISIPLAIINLNNGIVQSIQQIFNGASYFGHHAFIYPNIKGASPNGINDKGGVTSVDIKTTDIIVYDLATNSTPTYNNAFLVLADNNVTYRCYYKTVEKQAELMETSELLQYVYETNKDYCWNSSTTSYDTRRVIPFIEISLKNSIVTYFKILQPMRLATTDDKNDDNSHFLFDFKWADHTPNKLSWLRADTFSWQDGNIYNAAYNHLVSEGGDNISSWVVRSETIGSYTVSYRLAADGHKIAMPDQETTIQNIYESAGVAWYYILDEVNHRFKLPRTKFAFTGLRDGVGRYVAPGVPNVTDTLINHWRDYSNHYSLTTTNNAFYNKGMNTTKTSYPNVAGNSGGSYTGDNVLGFDLSRGNSIYGASNTVQPPATQMYLYAYIGYTDLDQLQKAEINIEAVTTNSINRVNTATEEGITRLNTDSNALNNTQIANCITEIPQDIKMELYDDNGTSRLKIKAGSKLYIPNGFKQDGTTRNFTQLTIETDIISNSATGTKTCFVTIDTERHQIFVSVPTTNCGSGNTNPTTGSGYYYNLTTNIIDYHSAETYEGRTYAFPLGIVEITSGAVTSIKQIFNGFGYIGSTIFALPGIKVLAPDGRNENGSLKNYESTVQYITLRTFTGIDKGLIALVCTNNSLGVGNYTYSEEENYIYINSTVYDKRCLVGSYTAGENGAILNFYTKKALKVLDSSEADYVIKTQRPTSANSYTWYRLYKSGWVEQGGHAVVLSSSGVQINLPITMQDEKYVITHSIGVPASYSSSLQVYINSGRTTSYFVAKSPNNTPTIDWEVQGFANI